MICVLAGGASPCAGGRCGRGRPLPPRESGVLPSEKWIFT